MIYIMERPIIEVKNLVRKFDELIAVNDVSFDVKKGDFALILPGETHQYKNTSDSKPFVMICAVPKEYE